VCGCARTFVEMPQEKKLVEVGRVVHITTGPCAGEIGAIVDIIDAKRLLVDGPRMPRREIKLKDMFLTRILLKIEKACSAKTLYAKWEKAAVDMRYKNTDHAKRLEKKAKRAAMTDFEFFKVRTAARTANKIKANCIKNLKEKYPRALAKMERSRRIDMGVKLGYRVVKQLTPEEKAVKEAREKIIRANRKLKSSEAYKLKKEKRAATAAKRKARLAKKKASPDFKPKKTVPKEKRVSHENKNPTTPHVSSVKEFRKSNTQALQANRMRRCDHRRYHERRCHRMLPCQRRAAGWLTRRRRVWPLPSATTALPRRRLPREHPPGDLVPHLLHGGRAGLPTALERGGHLRHPQQDKAHALSQAGIRAYPLQRFTDINAL